MSRRKKRYLVVGFDGDPCPRCNCATQVREHIAITEKQLSQPWYYSRWFYCLNPNCQTKQIMPDRYCVFRDNEAKDSYEAVTGFKVVNWRGPQMRRGC